MIYDKINKDLITNRKAKNKDVISILSTLKGELGRNCDGKPETLTDDQIIKIIRKNVDNVKETKGMLGDQSTDMLDLEIEVLEKYLPQMMSDDEIETTVKNVITTVGATSIRDMGKVMGGLKPYTATIDMKKASAIVKDVLS